MILIHSQICDLDYTNIFNGELQFLSELKIWIEFCVLSIGVAVAKYRG